MLKATLALVVLSLPLNLQAASTNRAADYEQVRRIAARDPKVRAAYEAADRKLAARIVEIDPTLKGYTPGASPKEPAHYDSPQRTQNPPRITLAAELWWP